ncbi:MAG: hypothetical protein AAF690_18175 [Acidobacteriota bacterium]
MAYAENTTVPAEKSRAEIDALVHKYGATSFSYMTEKQEGRELAAIMFSMENRYVRFVMPLPSRDDPQFWRHSRGRRTPEAARKQWDTAVRSSWRALLLAIKAKLESVERDISTFEQEFLAHIVMPDNRTLGEHVIPLVGQAYASGQMPNLNRLALGPASDFVDGEVIGGE